MDDYDGDEYYDDRDDVVRGTGYQRPRQLTKDTTELN